MAAARRRGASDFDALRWLEKQSAPILVAPVAISAEASYRLSVPNNAMDIVAKAWVRGNDSNTGDANPATHRTMKSIRPMLMMDGDAVHYLWLLAEPTGEKAQLHLETLCEIARSVAALGWGVDMAIGHGVVLSDSQAEAISGERWFPSVGTRTTLCAYPEKVLSRRWRTGIHGSSTALATADLLRRPR
jgi:CRISPR-associated protein Csb2